MLVSDERRTSGTYHTVDPPSGRHDPGSLGRSPSRQTETDLALTALTGRVTNLEKQFADLLSQHRDQGNRLSGLHTEFAVALSDLRLIKGSVEKMEKDIESSIARIEAKIESAINRLEEQRDKSGSRSRDIWRTVLITITAIASVAGFIIGLTR